MSDHKVSVTAIKYHTNQGKEYHPGDTYDVAADDVASLVGQGMVSQPETPAQAPKPSHPVEPMTTTNFGKG